MDDNTVDAIITDPPYYRVKGEDWDNQWKSESAFLAWIAELLVEFERILKPNGSLYFFASSKMAARVELEIGRRFNVLSHITWRKGKKATAINRTNKESLRSFAPTTEKIIFADHYNSDKRAKGETGYLAKCDELRGFIFEPLRAYIAGEFERARMLNTEGKIAANVACGFSASSGGMASRHYFSQSQWQLPTKKHYEAMRQLLNKSGGEYLRREYEDLRREYEYLRREYEDLRRPFNVTAKDQWGDIWEFDPVKVYKGKHPCEKPLPLLMHMLKASTKPNSIVFDPFAGSGSMGEACYRMGRSFIGVEKCPENYSKASQRLDAMQRQEELCL